MADGLCLPRAILKQVVHHQHGVYTRYALPYGGIADGMRKPHKYYRLSGVGAYPNW